MITNLDKSIRIRTSPRASYAVEAVGNGVIVVRQASGKARHLPRAGVGQGRYHAIVSMVLAAQRRAARAAAQPGRRHFLAA